ncbi:MAG: DNA-processing protein DprA [Dehalococcoidia bacterium]
MLEPAGDLKYWVAFHRIGGLGRARFALLERGFGLLADGWRASGSELRRVGLDEKTAGAVVQQRTHIDPDAEMERLARHGVWALTIRDSAYPQRLREIQDPPPVLYVRGELTPSDEWAVAAVGTRNATAYGLQIADEMAGELARNGITVVSGLALGIDAGAHRGALRAGGRTIAVLACGLDAVYPASHTRLAQEIQEHGALVSDYPLGTRPKPEHFPRRNRIMSGLSLGVLVVEGDVGSGAMITARLALEQNREVFAVPGDILQHRRKSRGTNGLIKRGEAKLVQGVEDILEELNLTMVPQQLEMREAAPVDETETALLRHLSPEPQHIDDVCRQSGLPVSSVSSALAMLELKGLVRQLGPMNYVRTREAEGIYQA